MVSPKQSRFTPDVPAQLVLWDPLPLSKVPWVINYVAAPCREDILGSGQGQAVRARMVREPSQGEEGP